MTDEYQMRQFWGNNNPVTCYEIKKVDGNKTDEELAKLFLNRSCALNFLTEEQYKKYKK